MAIALGGQKIDKQYGEWFEIWTELTQPLEKKAGYYQMIGKVDAASFKPSTFVDGMELYIPLNFWFCKNIGLALPLISLQYTEVDLVIEFREFEGCWVTNNTTKIPKKPKIEVKILIDYIYLDTFERLQFSQQSHIYLIDQLQVNYFSEIIGSVSSMDLIFNNPVKELIWVLQRSDAVCDPGGLFENSTYPIGNDWYNFSLSLDRSNGNIQDTFRSGVLQINGSDRFNARKASYFRLLHPYYYHTKIPTNFMYVYSFCLKPEELQPTGHLNFSRVDNVKLRLHMKNINAYNLAKNNINDFSIFIKVYAVSYNILIITSGMGGLLFP